MIVNYSNLMFEIYRGFSPFFRGYSPFFKEKLKMLLTHNHLQVSHLNRFVKFQ